MENAKDVTVREDGNRDSERHFLLFKKGAML